MLNTRLMWTNNSDFAVEKYAFAFSALIIDTFNNSSRFFIVNVEYDFYLS